MSAETIDDIVAALDSAMVVVTTTDGNERGGCLVGFHSQTSIEPRRYTVWLSKANHTYRLALRAEHVAVHFLGHEDPDLAELFGTLSGDRVDKVARAGPVTERHGVPLLDRCPNRLLGRRVALLDEGGDHVCLVLEPQEVSGDGRLVPLRLSDVSHLHPAHDADERHRPPTERAADG